MCRTFIVLVWMCRTIFVWDTVTRAGWGALGLIPILMAVIRLCAVVGATLLTLGAARAQGGLALALPAALQSPAAALLDQAQQTARLIEDPDAAGPAWAEIALAQALAGDVAGAKRLTAQVRDDSWKAEILKSVAIAQVRRGDLSGALATATSIGDDDAKAEALLEIAAAQVRGGDLPRARQTLAAARSALTSEYLGGLAPKVAFVRAAVGDLAGAQKAVASTSGEIDRALAQCELILGATLGGNLPLARQRLPVARQQVEALPEGATRSRALVRLAAALAQVGDTQDALTAAGQIADARNRTEAYLEIAERTPKASQRDAYRKAWSSAEGILQSVARAVAWCRIGAAAGACGEAEDAAELLRKARETADTLADPRDRVRALAALVRSAPSGAGLGAAHAVVSHSDLSAGFRMLALAGLRSPRPSFPLPGGAARPLALVDAARGLLSQVEPLASGRTESVKHKAEVLSALTKLREKIEAADTAGSESVLIELLGTATDPSSLLTSLAEQLALEPGQVDSLDEERSYNAFLILKECLAALRTDPAPTKLAAALSEVRLAMGALSFGPAERESVFLTLSSGKVSVAEILTRAESYVREPDPAALDKLAALVAEAAQKLADDSSLPERVRHPRIALTLGTLAERLDAARGK